MMKLIHNMFTIFIICKGADDYLTYRVIINSVWIVGD